MISHTLKATLLLSLKMYFPHEQVKKKSFDGTLKHSFIVTQADNWVFWMFEKLAADILMKLFIYITFTHRSWRLTTESEKHKV